MAEADAVRGDVGLLFQFQIESAVAVQYAVDFCYHKTPMKPEQKDRLRILALMSLTLVGTLVALQVATTKSARQDIERVMEQDARNVAAAVAKGLTLDTHLYRAVLDAKEPETADWWRLTDYLRTVKAQTKNIGTLKTEAKVGRDKIVGVLDADTEDSKPTERVGVLTDLDKKRAAALAQRKTVSYRMPTKKGEIITVHTPILDGKIPLGLVTVEVDPSAVTWQTARTVAKEAALAAGAVLLFMAVNWLTTGTLLDGLYRDRLTGAYKRRYFDHLLKDAVRKAKKKSHGLALMLVNMDDMKFINEKYGREFGDTMIKAVADALRKSLRQHDVLVRYGGNEFAVMAVAAGDKYARTIAERLRAAVAAVRVHHKRQDRDAMVSVSIGVSRLTDLSMEPETLLRRATIGLYEAKRLKNRVELIDRD